MDFKIYGPSLPISEETHSGKYRGVGETFREGMNRIAFALTDDDSHFYEFREVLLNMVFMPAGRVQAAVGSTKQITALNCYGSGTIEDNFTGENGITQRFAESIETMRHGGGIGYDFSTLRPRGTTIKTLGSLASGPVSFMPIFDGGCRSVSSAGHRRGAQMGVMRVDHPDIEEFVQAKQSHQHAPTLWAIFDSIPDDDPRKQMAFMELQNSNALQGFNMSVAVTDKFMRAVERGGVFNLTWEGQIYAVVDARTLWEKIMRSTWDYGEPGVLFIDRINKMNNLYYCETIATTNPCGEQPLPPFGACLLGSWNLVKFIRGSGKKKKFAWEMFKRIIPGCVRAMDNVIDGAVYPLPEQEREERTKRRMGLGVTGLANAGEALGFPYGSKQFLAFEAKIFRTIRDECYKASALLAKEKGPFPLFDKEKYLKGRFIRTLPKDIRELISKYGIRNSHLLSEAPTGTISLCADNVSSGIEPVFSYKSERTIRAFDTLQTEIIEDYGFRVFGTRGKTTYECTADDHLAVLITAQKYIDSAVSKTCNVDPKMPWEDFKSIYMKAWKGGCKGCTTFNPEGRRYGILNVAGEDDLSCEVNFETGVRSCE